MKDTKYSEARPETLVVFTVVVEGFQCCRKVLFRETNGLAKKRFHVSSWVLSNYFCKSGSE
jgi:hypothetical protein